MSTDGEKDLEASEKEKMLRSTDFHKVEDGDTQANLENGEQENISPGEVGKSSGSVWPQLAVGSIVNIAGVAAGIALGWPSPSLQKLKDPMETPLEYPLTPEQEPWVGSLIALGAALGPFPAGILCDKIGRKQTLLIGMVPFLVAWWVVSTTCNVSQLCGARLIMGVGVGSIFTAMPLYVAEIAQDSLRGALGSFMQLSITTGILLAYSLGPFISFTNLALICLLIPLIFMFTYWHCPASPYYLVSKGQISNARKALQVLRGTRGDSIEKELDSIKTTIEEARKTRTSFLTTLKDSPAARKALMLCLGLVAGQQLAGINVILFYTQPLFAAAGSDQPAHISAIIIGAVQVLASFITPTVVERLGRRLLLLVSAAGMAIALFSLGFYFFLQAKGSDTSNIGFLPVGSLVLYIIVYCIGYGPLPWAVMGELFPTNIKSTAATATASFCWLLGFLITCGWSSLVASLGMAGAFWGCAISCILSAIFVWTQLPETRGKSLAEIQLLLSGEK